MPRPYSPPVTRLSVGTHAHEYGFPSTHSSNACSMALYFGGIAVERWTGHWGVTVAAVAFPTFFAWSITFGRLYTGMVGCRRICPAAKLNADHSRPPQHSISDVVAGSAIGSALWLLYTLTYTRMNALIQNSRWTGTLVSIPTLLLLVTVHPEVSSRVHANRDTTQPDPAPPPGSPSKSARASRTPSRSCPSSRASFSASSGRPRASRTRRTGTSGGRGPRSGCGSRRSSPSSSSVRAVAGQRNATPGPDPQSPSPRRRLVDPGVAHRFEAGLSPDPAAALPLLLAAPPTAATALQARDRVCVPLTLRSCRQLSLT